MRKDAWLMTEGTNGISYVKAEFEASSGRAQSRKLHMHKRRVIITTAETAKRESLQIAVDPGPHE